MRKSTVEGDAPSKLSRLTRDIKEHSGSTDEDMVLVNKTSSKLRIR